MFEDIPYPMMSWSPSKRNPYDYFDCEFDEGGLVRPNRKKHKRLGYIMDHTPSTFLIAAFHWFRIFMNHVDPYVFGLMLIYLEDINVRQYKYRQDVWIRRKLLIQYDYEYLPSPEHMKIGMNYGFKLTTAERFRRMIVVGYSRAIFANASEGELHNWAKIIHLLSKNKPGYIVMHEISDTVFSICIEDDEYMLWFRRI